MREVQLRGFLVLIGGTLALACEEPVRRTTATEALAERKDVLDVHLTNVPATARCVALRAGHSSASCRRDPACGMVPLLEGKLDSVLPVLQPPSAVTLTFQFPRKPYWSLHEGAEYAAVAMAVPCDQVKGNDALLTTSVAPTKVVPAANPRTEDGARRFAARIELFSRRRRVDAERPVESTNPVARRICQGWTVGNERQNRGAAKRTVKAGTVLSFVQDGDAPWAHRALVPGTGDPTLDSAAVACVKITYETSKQEFVRRVYGPGFQRDTAFPKAGRTQRWDAALFALSGDLIASKTFVSDDFPARFEPDEQPTAYIPWYSYAKWIASLVEGVEVRPQRTSDRTVSATPSSLLLKEGVAQAFQDFSGRSYHGISWNSTHESGGTGKARDRTDPSNYRIAGTLSPGGKAAALSLGGTVLNGTDAKCETPAQSTKLAELEVPESLIVEVWTERRMGVEYALEVVPCRDRDRIVTAWSEDDRYLAVGGMDLVLLDLTTGKTKTLRARGASCWCPTAVMADAVVQDELVIATSQH